jgi:penicillin-binding protein 1B
VFSFISQWFGKLWIKFILLFVVLGIAATLYLDNIIRHTFTDKMWSVPSTVYARPLELYQGAVLTPDDLKTELQLLGYQFVNQVNQPKQVVWGSKTVTIYTSSFQFSDELEPARKVKLTFNNGMISQLSSDDSAFLIRLEPVVIGGIYPSHNEDRLLVKLSEVPQTLLDMLVAVEDNDFYHHYGISFRGIGRALFANIKEGSIVQGASTLTQQLIKNYYLSSERTLWRKAQEAMMAVLLEVHYTKKAILEGYINEVYLGQDGPRSIHGFGLASQYYFKKPLSDLSISQQALLVALVRGASYYNPWRNPDRVLQRRNLVLDIAVRENSLDENQAALAKTQPLIVGERLARGNKRYPAYLDLVRRQLQRDYDAQSLSSDGLSIFTHFDPLAQSAAENSLTAAIAKQTSTKPDIPLQGAVVITRPNTGAVLAIVGGADARYAGFNRAIDSRRQVGSLIKPAVYLTALEKPEQYTLASLLSDDHYEQKLSNGDIWSPKNYDRKDHGDVMLYQALAHSYNQATARLGNNIGLKPIIETIHRLGVIEEIPELPSVTLGAVGMSPLDVAQMYQTLSADGFYTPLQTISAVVDSSGQLLKHYPLAIEKRFDAETIYLLRYALQSVTHEGTAKALQWLLPNFTVAGKTGTSNDLRDSWFAGFSGDLQAVVWMGRDDNESSGLTGSSGALRVWADIFKLRSQLPLQNIPPKNIAISWVDSNSGVGSQDTCSNAIPVPFKKGSEPLLEIKCLHGVDKVINWFHDLLE